jgi:hypothetical protein
MTYPTVPLASVFLAMDIIKLALLALHFLLIAFAITAAVSLGPWVLGRKPIGAQFWSMFGVTCVILLILNALVLTGSSE